MEVEKGRVSILRKGGRRATQAMNGSCRVHENEGEQSRQHA